jgi:hypothetical protein
VGPGPEQATLESEWGNPFKLENHERGPSLRLYREWVVTGRNPITSGKRSQGPLLWKIGELEGKTLGCWCSPEACHGDVLSDLLRDRAVLQSLPPSPPPAGREASGLTRFVSRRAGGSNRTEEEEIEDFEEVLSQSPANLRNAILCEQTQEALANHFYSNWLQGPSLETSFGDRWEGCKRVGQILTDAVLELPPAEFKQAFRAMRHPGGEDPLSPLFAPESSGDRRVRGDVILAEARLPT